jgi:hypothetical protein
VTAVRVAIPDLVSNSYFPAIAAIALGFFAKEGLAASHELIFPNYKACEALRDGRVDFVAGTAHVTFRRFHRDGARNSSRHSRWACTGFWSCGRTLRRRREM